MTPSRVPYPQASGCRALRLVAISADVPNGLLDRIALQSDGSLAKLQEAPQSGDTPRESASILIIIITRPSAGCSKRLDPPTLDLFHVALVGNRDLHQLFVSQQLARTAWRHGSIPLYFRSETDHLVVSRHPPPKHTSQSRRAALTIRKEAIQT